MKKLIAAAALVFGLFLGSHLTPSAQAVNPVVSPKPSGVLSYTTTASTFTIGPTVLYAVNLTTGATQEFVAIFDTNTATGYNGAGTAITSQTTSSASGFKFRVYYSSVTANTQYRFDPPLQLYYGLQAVDSAGSGAALFEYEQGYTSGQ